MALTIADLLVKLSADPSDFEQGVDRVSRRVEGFSTSMGQVGQQLTIGLSLPLAATGAAAMKMAADFDFSLTMITSLVGIARDTVMGWRDEIRQIAKDTGRNARELADAMFYITSAGMRGSDAMDVLRASAQAAMVGLGETRLVAFAAVSAMNAYGAANLDAETAVATLIATIREGNVMANTLAPTLGRVLPVASAMGVEFHEVGAALAAMTRVGLNAEESATSLRQIIASISNPTAEARKQLTEMGISADFLRAKIKDNLLDALFYLRDTFQGNEEAIFKVFGNIRALTGVLNLTGANADKARLIFESLAKTTGEDLVNAVDAASVSMKVQWMQAMQKLNDAMLQLGMELLPVIIPLLETFASVVEELVKDWRDLSPAVKEIILGFGMLVVAIGPALYSYSKLSMLLAAVNGLMHKQSIAIAGVTTSSAKLPLMARGWTAAFTTLGGAVSLVGAAFAGWEIGRLISDLTGLTEASSKMGDEMSSIKEGIVELPGSLESIIKNTIHMSKEFGTFGEQVATQNAAIAAMVERDATRLLIWNEEFMKRSRENQILQAQIRDEKEKQVAAAEEFYGWEFETWRATLRTNDATKKAADDLIEKAEKKLLTEQEVIDAINAQFKATNDLLNKGYGFNQVMEIQKADWEKLLTYADEYGTKYPLGAQNLIDLMKKEGYDVLAEMVDRYDSLNDSIDLTPGKIIPMFDRIGEAGERTGEILTGSLVKSFDTAKEKAGEFAQWIEDHPLQWDVEFMLPNPETIVNDVMDGRYPPSGGRKP